MGLAQNDSLIQSDSLKKTRARESECCCRQGVEMKVSAAAWLPVQGGWSGEATRFGLGDRAPTAVRSFGSVAARPSPQEQHRRPALAVTASAALGRHARVAAPRMSVSGSHGTVF
jgi:hypothetical protein